MVLKSRHRSLTPLKIGETATQKLNFYWLDKCQKHHLRHKLVSTTACQFVHINFVPFQTCPPLKCPVSHSSHAAVERTFGLWFPVDCACSRMLLQHPWGSPKKLARFVPGDRFTRLAQILKNIPFAPAKNLDGVCFTQQCHSSRRVLMSGAGCGEKPPPGPQRGLLSKNTSGVSGVCPLPSKRRSA